MQKSAALAIGLQGTSRLVLEYVDPDCELTETTGTEQAFELLRQKRFQAIFIDARSPGFSPTDLDHLRVLAPNTPKAVVGAAAQAPMIQALSISDQFSFLSTDLPESSFALATRRVMQPRTSERVSLRHEGRLVTGMLADRPFSHALLDLSNRGLSFAIPPGSPLDGVNPGAAVTELRIIDATGQVLLGPVNGTVRHCAAERLVLTPIIRVGLSIDPPAPKRAPHVRVLDESLPIVHTIRRAVQGGASLVLTLPDAEAGYRFRDAQILEEDRPGIELPGPVPAALRLHDVVRLSFSHQGQSYSGLTAIVEVTNGLRLALPRSLRVHHRRGSNRHKPLEERSYRVRLCSPLADREESFEVDDINATGFSVIADRSLHLLAPGMILDPLEITLPDGGGPIVGRGIVRSLTALARRPEDTDGSPARCGVELLQLADADRTRLSQCLIGDGFAHIEGARPEDFDEIMRFFDEAKFSVRQYKEPTPRNQEILQAGFGQLLRPERPAGASLVFRSEGTIRGHVTGLELYSKTILITHLAAIQGGTTGADRISRALVLGILEYAEQQPHIEFVRGYWVRDFSWPNRMAGFSAATVHRPGLSDQHDFLIAVRGNDRESSPVDGVQVRTAREEDLPRIERHLLESRSLVRIQSEDLTIDQLALDRVNARYGAHGLTRRRHIRVAWVDGVPAGYAFLERTTAAIQLAEVTNAFEVQVFPVVPTEVQAKARAALIADATEYYRREGLANTIALIDDSDRETFENAGFRVATIARSWTWHRSQFRGWTDVWDQILVRGKEIFGSRKGK